MPTPLDRPIATEATLMNKPFLFNEAELPQGYPKPGPVGEVIIKSYPSSRFAMVQASNAGAADANGMFWPLFKHIKKENIPMSSPVMLGYSSPDVEAERGPASMAFVYGDARIGRAGNDGDVQVVDVPTMTVASVGIRGSYDAQHMEQGLEKIRSWLAQQGGKYEFAGLPRYLAYNSPFVPWFLKYGEVQVPVKEH